MNFKNIVLSVMLAVATIGTSFIAEAGRGCCGRQNTCCNPCPTNTNTCGTGSCCR